MAGVRIVTPDWLWACPQPVGGHDPWLAETEFPVLCVAGEQGEEDGGREGRDPGLALGMRRALGEGRREALPSRSVRLLKITVI
jgi:hypothetical protein